VRVVNVFLCSRVTLPLILVALLVPASCAVQPRLNTTAGVQPTDAPVVVAPARWQPDGPVPAPTGPVVLTLTGKIGQRSLDRSALHFDAAILDELGVVKAKVYDPWVKQELEFQGVWMNDLINAAKPTSGAQSIHITALDNYQIDLSLADVRAGGILVATKRGDGSPLPIDEGGPVRVVFVGGVPSGASADQWIWSLTMIDLR
jgi:hypothetical protein